MHDFAIVQRHPVHGQQALFAVRSFEPGAVICNFTAGTVSAEPTYLTIQLDEQKHITLLPPCLQYTNHSCDPNIFFDTTHMAVVCLKHIDIGSELTFFYPSTEWNMAQPFDCLCGSPACLGRIAGAGDLDRNVLEPYRLTDFIRKKLG